MIFRFQLAAVVLAAFPLVVSAQVAPDEVAIARSAAPKEVSGKADVYVYREESGAFERAVAGTNGVACLVTRDANPDARYPQCLSAAATQWVLPLIFEEHRLRRSGKSESEIDSYLDKAYRAAYARHSATAGPVSISYMMSPHQVIFAGPGRRIGRWRPHLMVYSPGASLEDFALTDASRHFGINSAGQGPAHLLVVVPAWADSTAAPQSTRPTQP